MKKPKLIVVAGPTSSGKTSYAIKLAKKINGEVISADSRQVYKGLNLLSGKVSKKEMRGIPHHLLDIASPKKIFSVTDFQKLASIAINDIHSRGKNPIVCGGTGFYIDALVYDRILPEVLPNKKLRATLDNKTPVQLFSMLTKLDPTRAKTIDKDNPVRLIRAIEIAKALGSVPKLSNPESKYQVEWIMLDLPDAKLRTKISSRLKERIKSGIIREAKKLHESGVSFKRMESLGLECRSTARYLKNIITKKEMITELEKDIWQYAKRQRTWFNKYAR